MQHSRSAKDVYRVLAELAAEGRDCALAMVLRTEGSSPCRAGAKAIMDATDVIQGTIGGGLLEATIQRRVAETLASGRAIIVDFGLQSSSVDDAEPICGGSVRVLVDPAVGRHRDAYLAACEMRDRRRRGVVLTTIEPAASAGLDQRNVAVETFPERAFSERALAAGVGFPGADAVRAVLRRETPRLFVSESAPAEQRLEVFVEPLVPLPVVVVVGGGHVGQAVAAQATAVGFAVVVIDDRPEFTRPELYPEGATLRCGEIAAELADIPLANDSYVVIATRGHRHDAAALAACIRTPAAYVGMIGSRRKVAMMRHDFIQSGSATAEEFDRVYAPIGLEIGAETVPEIATSITAQLIAVRRKGSSPRIDLE